MRYRALPQRGSAVRRRIDATLAAVILAMMTLVGASFWGPVPAAWLWVGSQAEYVLGSVSFGILVAFFGMLFTLLLGLVVMKRLDTTWILVRRAAGHDQRTGVMTAIFAVSTALGTAAFVFWLLFLEGPGPTLAPAS